MLEEYRRKKQAIYRERWKQQQKNRESNHNGDFVKKVTKKKRFLESDSDSLSPEIDFEVR